MSASGRGWLVCGCAAAVLCFAFGVFSVVAQSGTAVSPPKITPPKITPPESAATRFVPGIESARSQVAQRGSGGWMRKHYFTDLEPIALTPGGPGTLVILYNGGADISIAFSPTYDMMLGVKPGRVDEGWRCGPKRCDE